MKKVDKGFTIIELLISLGIMLVIVAIISPSFIKLTESSKRKADIVTARNIALASQAYLLDHPEEETTDIPIIKIKDYMETKDLTPQSKGHESFKISNSDGNITVSYSNSDEVLYPLKSKGKNDSKSSN